MPDMQVPLTERGRQQAHGAGHKIRAVMEADQMPFSLFFYTSPYKVPRCQSVTSSRLYPPADPPTSSTLMLHTAQSYSGSSACIAVGVTASDWLSVIGLNHTNTTAQTAVDQARFSRTTPD